MHYMKMSLMIFLIGFGITAQTVEMPGGGPPRGSTGKDPLMERLDVFAAKDKAGMPLSNAVEFAGSSMFEGWTAVTEHMDPMPAFNRSIGGSKTADILKHLDQLIIQYKPKVVVLYSGINDVSEGVSPATAADNIQKIIEAINAGLPGTRVIYIAILNASNRPDSVELINNANARIKEYAAQNPRMAYLDISSALVDDNGATRKEFLDNDRAHYNSAAYDAMAKVVKPAVQKEWTK
jgi:GDSL-like Lipase/Acylhydrolase family